MDSDIRLYSGVEGKEKFNLKLRFITTFYTDTSKREENSAIAVTSAVCFNK
jgi:hypothetical protein